MRRKLAIAGFITGLVLLGLFREAFFVHLNYILYYKYFQNGVGYEGVMPLFAPLEVFSYRTLYISKWFITPAFAGLFWFIQKKFIAFLFHEKKPVFWLGMLYLSLLLLAGISLGAGWLLGSLETGYRFSRMFMGLLQSPAPCMVLIPLTYFYKNNSV